MSFYKTCPDCGAHLDPGEPCDCKKNRAALLQQERPTEKEAITNISFKLQKVKCLSDLQSVKKKEMPL